MDSSPRRKAARADVSIPGTRISGSRLLRPRAFAPEAPPPFHLADFIRLLDARRKLIIRVALGTILFALAVALLLPTTYASSAVVMLDPRKNNITDLSAVLTPLASDPAAVQNQIQIITSRDLAAMVVDRLKLDDDPEFNPRLDQPSLTGLLGEMVALLNPRNWFESADARPASRLSRERVIDNFATPCRADAEGLSTTITITATSRDAAKAALIANTLADAYVKSQVADKIDATNATTGWLNKRLSGPGAAASDPAGGGAALQGRAQSQRFRAGQFHRRSADGGHQRPDRAGALGTGGEAGRSTTASASWSQSGNPADVAQIVSSPLIVQLRDPAGGAAGAGRRPQQQIRPAASQDAGDPGTEARSGLQDRPGSEPPGRQRRQ